MIELYSRRRFLAATTAALVVPSIAWSYEAVPMALDHIILACNDLDRGIEFVKARTGATAEFSGVHPGRGTRNALLSLGDRHYLEILAPDPQQQTHPAHREMKSFAEPRLVGWAAHPKSIEDAASRLRKAGIAFTGPTDGSRRRPDGSVLRWRTLTLKDDGDGSLPFCIEWSADSVHPSVSAPSGCQLIDFSISAPDPKLVERTLEALRITVTVRQAHTPGLHALIAGPKGKAELT